MSRCSSLYQALANASANSSGFSRNRREICSYDGSVRSARSVVSIIGACFFDGSCASGTASAAAPPVGFHCFAPAGLSVSSHSKPNSVSKKLLSHFVGVGVHAPSRPLVIVSPPLPVPNSFFQPSPIACTGQPSGSGPTSDGSPAPCVLPNV